MRVAHAQGHLSSEKNRTSVGLGVGLPYGAIGLRLGTNIATGANLFGGVGYMVSGIGYNIGLRKDFDSERASQFYMTGMYGTNAAIKVVGLPEYDQVYIGATFGLGIKVNSRKNEGNYWDMGMLIPVRSSEYNADENRASTDPRVTSFTRASPVLITVGYNFTM